MMYSYYEKNGLPLLFGIKLAGHRCQGKKATAAVIREENWLAVAIWEKN